MTIAVIVILWVLCGIYCYGAIKAGHNKNFSMLKWTKEDECFAWTMFVCGPIAIVGSVFTFGFIKPEFKIVKLDRKRYPLTFTDFGMWHNPGTNEFGTFYTHGNKTTYYDQEGNIVLDPYRSKVRCFDCGPKSETIDHYYTSKEGGYHLCHEHFKTRKDKGRARLAPE